MARDPGETPNLADRVSENGTHIVLPKNYTVDQMKEAMIIGVQRLQATGCIAENPFPEPMQDFQRQTLRFKAGDWGQKGTATED